MKEYEISKKGSPSKKQKIHESISEDTTSKTESYWSESKMNREKPKTEDGEGKDEDGIVVEKTLDMQYVNGKREVCLSWKGHGEEDFDNERNTKEEKMNSTHEDI